MTTFILFHPWLCSFLVSLGLCGALWLCEWLYLKCTEE